MKKYTTMLLLMITLFLAFLIPGRYSSAAHKKPRFNYKYHQLKVGKTCHFSIKYKRKTDKIIYTSSNKHIASIGKRTGVCTGKKPGRVTIYAKIYRGKNKKSFTLRHSLRVIKSTLLPNASFRMVQSINPYNYTVKIRCSRILLKKEVRKSKLTLTKKGNSSPLTACFSSLSSNGRELTYTLTSRSQKKLCPKNGTMNGTYRLSSSLFRKKLSATYRERIGNYALSGYVFSPEGNPVNKAYIKCKTKYSVMTCYTDSRGYYHLEKAKNPVSLTITKSGCLSETLTDLATSAKTTRCENIILHTRAQNSFSAQFHVTEQRGTAISNASIYLLQGSYTVTGETDKQGNVLFYTDTVPHASPCTKWSIGQQRTLTYENNFTPTTAHSKKIQSLSLDKTCTLLIGKKPQENSPGYEFYQFTLCPSDYISQQFYFDVKLSDSSTLSLKNLSLRCDNIDSRLCTALHFSLYQEGCTKPVFITRFTKDFFSIASNRISFSQDVPCSVPEGLYYVRIEMIDEKENTIAFFPMAALSVREGNFPPRQLSCLPSSYGRILAHGDFASTNATASFERYQCVEGQYYYIDTLSTQVFQGEKWDTKTANLIIPCMEAETSYLLLPVKGNITGESHIKFTAAGDGIFVDKNTAISYSPLGKVSCIPTPENYSPELPSELVENTGIPGAATKITATKSYVRSCPSYPNSVTVFYKKDGTFLSASLTTSPSQNINTAKNNHTIMDIYTNGKTLSTTQNSYH